MTDARALLLVTDSQKQAAESLTPPCEVITESELTPERYLGREIIAVPDNDPSIIARMTERVKAIRQQTKSIKIIDPTSQPAGWGFSDVALEHDWDWFITWSIAWTRIVTLEVDAQVVLQGDQEPPSDVIAKLWEDMGLKMGTGKIKIPLNNLNNALRVFQMSERFKGLVWFDEFHDKVFTNWNSPDNPREWTDADDRALTVLLQREFDLQKFDVPLVAQAIQAFSEKDIRNEPKQWLNGLVWDGVERLDRFLIDLMGAPDTPYHKAVAKNMFIAMCARIDDPMDAVAHPNRPTSGARLGQKVDNMVILKGEQGEFKSSALEIIGGKWYVAAGNQDIGDAEFLKILRGKILLEFADLKKFKGADQNTLKACITIRKDTYRDSYGRHPKDRFRTCIFAGTTNDNDFLKDETGARRFWTVIIGKIHLRQIAKQREQLFAEAFARYKTGESWWEVPAEEHKEISDHHFQQDEWEDPIRLWISNRNVEETSAADVWDQCFEGSKKHMDMLVSRRVNSIMKHLGWSYHLKRFTDEKGEIYRKRVWIKPKKTNQESDLPF